ncbi:hypothetical protein PTSG_11442, partial [Salpingoeca rosetta]
MPRRREDVPLRGKKSGSGEGGVPAIRSRGRAATTSVAATLAQASPSTLRKAERSSSMSKVKMTGTSTGPISGFICPACPNLINFESETLLLRHWEACHEQEVSSISVQDNTDTAWREHLFTDTCRAGKTCRFCGHRIWRDGLQCKTCRYACHIKCVTKAKPVSNCPGFYQSTNPIVKGIRKVVTGYENGSEVLTGPIEQCVQDSQELNAINAMMNAQPLHIRFANKKQPAGEDGKKFEKTRDSAAISEYFK